MPGKHKANMWPMHVECMSEEVQHMSKACSIINERREQEETHVRHMQNTCKTHVREDATGSHVKRSYDRVTCQVMG